MLQKATRLIPVASMDHHERAGIKRVATQGNRVTNPGLESQGSPLAGALMAGAPQLDETPKAFTVSRFRKPSTGKFLAF
jgi:hypothetical protein